MRRSGDGVHRSKLASQSLGSLSRAKGKRDLRRKTYAPLPGFRSAPCRAGKCNDCYSMKCTCKDCHRVP